MRLAVPVGAATLLGVLFAAAPAPAAPSVAPAASPVSPPRAEIPARPAAVFSNRILTQDTVWRGEVVVEGAVTVAPQATLSVEPGTVVRFRRSGEPLPVLMVQGRLVAQGTKELPIAFGSPYAVALAGDWQGIVLLGSEKKNLLEHCRIEGAETGIEALFSNLSLKEVLATRSGTGMSFQDALVAMEGGGASECGTALKISETELNALGASVQGNRAGIQAVRSALYLDRSELKGNTGAALVADRSRIKVQGGAIRENGSGITLVSCEGSVSAARLVWNRRFGLSLSNSRMRISGNQISDNGDSGIVVEDGAAVAWDNVIADNGGFDLYNAGVEEFRAPGNWWGKTSPRIFDNGGKGRVRFAPILMVRPQVTP